VSTSITFPKASNNPIPTNFMARGATTGKISGGTLSNGTNTVAATNSAQNDGDWTLSFQNVPPGTGYVLSVECAGGGASQDGLTVAGGP
jgi:hypothetical protein